ncbi:6-phosphofructokinase [Roseibacillus ishigakijimensis]|uniref:ATP-dependent 6-phosphofructokinase n=1 Tax=Roseibacillus ishigakijimensis TaxID=454146 RepID=A0A934RQ53_9BACT|nr:ATP-dependent 6-phosphofructokinase [Roseibacillus ishigakijimensis]MBK1834925.1 6-phosphofructokinase [Roseibacillus ishigakijimensis]
MRIGILNSGGDCPGLNAVIHGVVGAASEKGWEVVGFRDGFEGLLPPGDFQFLKRADTAGILKLGGTILGTTNKGNFAAKVGAGDVAKVPQEIIDRAKRTLDQLEIGALVVVGGDGSLTTAHQLYEDGWPVIGVPKTIDNDLQATAMTFGFDSAVTSVVDGLDRLNTTASSHKRVMVLEVMGRHAGWIALWGGMAGGANVVLLPEIPFQMEKVAEFIKLREAQGHHSSLIVVAEGAKMPEGLIAKENTHGGEVHLGGVGAMVAEQVEKMTGKETRACTLGHLQRGGGPTALDRILGLRFGVMAVNLASEGNFGQMVSYQSYHVGSVPIKEAVHQIRAVDPDGEVVNAAKAIGISFGQ